MILLMSWREFTVGLCNTKPATYAIKKKFFIMMTR